ncbi:MAG: dihydrodipicolinate synthase family protein [Microbacteriaceae bacterium]|nr:dihydrodipicolinate synthase family protein [Microbacteriaceae bacterium]
MSAGHQRLDDIIPILQMPFDDREEIVYLELGSQVDFLVANGVSAVGFGFGSDILRLSESEVREALRAVTGYAAGRVRVMATVGGGSIRALVVQGVEAARAGADILMMRPPGGCDEQQIEAACSELSAATGLPIVFQDAPELTLVEVSADLLESLVERVPGIVALKIECPDPVPKIARLSATAGQRVSVLGGSGGFAFLDELDAGVNGTVPPVAFAPALLNVQALHAAGQRDQATDAFDRLRPLIDLAVSQPASVNTTFKELLRLMGVLRLGTGVRRPDRRPAPELLAGLESAASAAGLLVGAA